jgi:hypothetical protein
MKVYVWAMMNLHAYLKGLREATLKRQATESVLADMFEDWRQYGEMSRSKTTLERRFIGEDKKEWICREWLVGGRGFFEMAESLDPMPSIRRKLVGSCLFMYE